MCTFHNDREVEVCDVAIGSVEAKLAAELGGRVKFTRIEGQATLLVASHAVDVERFRNLVNAGIQEAAGEDNPRKAGQGDLPR